MSKDRRSQSARQLSRKPRGRAPSQTVRPVPARTNRTQLVFAILSSLVICGLIGAAVASVSPAGLFDDSGADDASDAENFQDPNQDVIAEQQTVVAARPDDIEELLLLANLYGNSSRVGEAIPIYERVLSMVPEDASARLSFARVLADAGMTADAELQFTKVLELDPNSQPAHYYLAELLRLSSPPRMGEAIDHYRRASEIDGTTLISERSREQLGSLGLASPAGGTSTLSTPVSAEKATP